jgi:hypothetical protein
MSHFTSDEIFEKNSQLIFNSVMRGQADPAAVAKAALSKRADTMTYNTIHNLEGGVKTA